MGVHDVKSVRQISSRREQINKEKRGLYNVLE